MKLDVHLEWLVRRAPLLSVCRYNEHHGFETWWRGVIVGPIAIGLLWRTKRSVTPDKEQA